VLHDPRIDIRFGDGRAALLRSSVRYDVIEADALRPMSAYAGNLYSLEFFSLLRDRLEPGGVVVSWAPTKRIRRTFIQAFPHVWLAKEFAVGSNQPIAMDADAIRERARSPFARAWYDAAGIDLGAVISKILAMSWNEVGPDFDRSGLVDVNTDLYPRDEYGVAEGK
jgi:spermidine synthase